MIDLDLHGSAVFDCVESGRTAQIKLLKKKSGKTIPEMLGDYSKADYSGETHHSAQAEMIYKTGDSQGVELRNKKIGDMTDDEIQAMAEGISKFEGWHEGAVTRTGASAAIAVIDQANQPVEGVEYHIKKDNKVIAKGKTDAKGHSKELHNRTSTEHVSLHVKNYRGVFIEVANFVLGQYENLFTIVAPTKHKVTTKEHKGAIGTHEHQTYKVKAGDTLAAIAKKHHTSVQYLADINHIHNVNRISLDQMIKVPASRAVDHRETSKKIKHVPKRDVEGAPVTVVEKPSAAPSAEPILPTATAPSGSNESGNATATPSPSERAAKLIEIMTVLNQYSARENPDGHNKNNPKVPGWTGPGAIEAARNLEQPPHTKSGKKPEGWLGLCATYVKIGLAASGYVKGYMDFGSARDGGPKLKKQKYRNIYTGGDVDLRQVPAGAVFIYSGSSDGHIEIWSGNSVMSDYIANHTRTQTVQSNIMPEHGRGRTLTGIWVKE